MSLTPIPDDIQSAYTNLAARMGDLVFRERDVLKQLTDIRENMATLETERQGLTTALRERLNAVVPQTGETTPDVVATPSA